MAFRIFRLVLGVVVLALAAWLTWQGVTGVIEALHSQNVGAQLTRPVSQLVGAILVLVLLYLGLIARSRVRQVLENIFAVPELLTKLGFTAGLLAIYRIGYFIPVPGMNQADWMNKFSGGSNPFSDALETVAMFSGGNFKRITLFGLGIMPYITASIIFQLLGTVVPSIERLQREGESGRRKIQEYTRYATVALCLVQSMFLMGQANMYGGFGTLRIQLMGVLGMTAGTMFMMWLGEQIDEYGIGNGISLLIMAGILARMPAAVSTLVRNMTLSFGGGEAGGIGPERIVVLIAMFVFVTAGAILITQGQRRIPIQQAKVTRGRRIFGGQRTYLPLRVNHGGVMPIIFASAIMMFPSLLFHAINGRWRNGVTNFLESEFRGGHYLYEMCYIGMIFFFAYFWTTVQFRPKEMAEQLRDHGNFIPGLRPGRRTAEYLEHVMERITYCGAAFLAVISVIPTLVANGMHIEYSVAAFLGGTGLLISVSVTLDLVQRIEAQLVMRNYGGFLGEGTRIKGAYA